MIITFSGLDGSGKTTLIKHLVECLDYSSIKYKSYTIYHHISIYALLRRLRSLFVCDNNLNEEINNKKNTYKVFRSKKIKRIFLLGDVIIVTILKYYYAYTVFAFVSCH